jgi:hypothetical protein
MESPVGRSACRLFQRGSPFPTYYKKRVGSDSPKPDPDGHSRGLPQSFTRSQKERPLGEYILSPDAPPLVANRLCSHDEFETGHFFHFPPFFLLKASEGTGTSNLASRILRTVSPIACEFETRRNGIITPSTLR